MKITVNRAKVVLPRRRSDLLSRQRLLDLLVDLLNYRLTLISAPAGYGKTSLLVDFAHQAEYPICWYALEAVDQDLQRFLTHFISAIQQRFPAFGGTSLAIVKSIWQSGLDIDQLVTSIVNEIYEHISEHFALVLDDYHLVDSSAEINHFVSRFVQAVDENCHLMIASRTMVDLPDLPLLVGRSQVKGLNFDDLAFQAEEIQALLQRNYHQLLSKEEADALVRQTEGWITALLLSAETMWRGMADQVRLASVAGVGLYDYLAQQVFDQQAPQIQDFLLRSSLFDEFNAELCAAVLGQAPESQSWEETITTVLQNNLFVQPVENGGTWLRYHHLFRNFLQGILKQERPEGEQEILLRLIEAYGQRQEWEKAYAICQRLADEAVTIGFIEKAGVPLIANGRYSILAKWIDALPAQVLNSHPVLLAQQGRVAMWQGEIERGRSLLNEAELHLPEGSPHLSRALTWRAFAHCKQGKYQQALRDANRALEISRKVGDQQIPHAEALEVKGECLYFVGRRDEAIQHIEQALKIFTALADHENMAYANMALGYMIMNSGQYKRANRYYLKALEINRLTNNLVRQSEILLNLGAAFHYLGDLRLAQANYCESLNIARQIGHRPFEALALANLGEIYADLHLFNAAIEMYQQARIIAQRAEQRHFILELAIWESERARANHRIEHAQRILSSVEAIARETEAVHKSGLWALEKGCLSLAKEEIPTAVVHLEKAVRDLETTGFHLKATQAHLYLAFIHHIAEEHENAAHHLHAASQNASKLDSLFSLIPAGCEVKGMLKEVTASPVVGKFATRLIDTIEQFDRDLPGLRRLIRQQSEQVDLSQPELTIQALGAARVHTYAEEVTRPEWSNQKAVRELFYLLLAHPKGLNKEAIGDTLWPNSIPEQHYKQLNNTVYRLRRALGKEVVVFDTQSNCYQFNWQMDYHYDVEEFQAAVKRARRAKRTARKIAAYQQAIALYGGAYLPEVGGTWAVPMREFLRRTYTETVLQVAELYFKEREYKKALGYCQQLLNDDQYQEAAHRLAMRAYAARGDRVEIARQYEFCRQSLQQLDTAPSAETERLYAQLMR